jgi:hypothetical protein
MNKDIVLRSVNNDSADRCVDFFERGDTSTGFKLFRRDPEDQGAWTLTDADERRFATYDDAVAAAVDSVEWLADALQRSS